MKKFTFGLLVICSVIGIAGPGEAGDPTRDLQNLVFYPHARAFSFIPAYQASLTEVGPKLNSSSTETQSSSTTNIQAPLSLTYGITENWRIGVSQTQLIQQTITTTAVNTGAASSTNANGPSSPQFTLTWRAPTNQKSFLYTDIDIQITPQNGTHLSASGMQVGNDLTAESVSSLGVSWYWFFHDEEAAIEPVVAYRSSGLSQSATSNVTIAPFITGSVEFIERSHVNKYFYIQPMLTVSLPYSYATTNQVSENIITYNYSTGLSPEVQFGYLMRSWCLMTFSVVYASNTYTTVSAPSTANQTVDYNSSTAIGLRLVF